MPIRVPTVTSQQGVDLGTTPQIGDTAGSEASAAIQQSIAQIDRAARDYAHVNAQLTKADMKLDVDSKLTRVKDRLVEEDVMLRQEGIEPDQLPEEYRKRGMKVIAEEAANLHYPVSAKEFQVRAEEQLGIETRKQAYRALDIKFARSSIAAELQIQENINTAVFYDHENPNIASKVRAEATDQALGIVNQMVGMGIWDKGVGETKTNKILEQVSLGRAERLFQDPEKQAVIIEQMSNGQLKYVDPIKQMTTAKAWQKQAQENDRQRDQRAKEFWEREQESNILEYSQLAAKKQLTIPELDRNARQWQWKATEYDRVLAILTAPPKEEPSNPNTRTRVLADTHSAYPTMSERAILDLGPAPRGNGQLNTTDMLNAIDHLRATTQHNLTEAKDEVQRAYGQGKQRVKAALGIPDQITDKFDDPRMGIWSEALNAYDLRAKGARGSENPNKVADEVAEQYQKILGRKAIDDLATLQSALKYQTKAEVEAAASRKVNPISPGEAEAQKRLITRRDELVKEAAITKAKKDAEQNKQEPGGFLNWFRGQPPPANLNR